MTDMDAPPPANIACACGRLRRATRALTQLYDDAMAPSGLHRVAGRLPVVRGARVYAHQDTVSGVSELALATQFRQGNVISRVMIVGTPGLITRVNLLATARRQAMRVAQDAAGVAGARAQEGGSASPHSRTLPAPSSRGAREVPHGNPQPG